MSLLVSRSRFAFLMVLFVFLWAPPQVQALPIPTVQGMEKQAISIKVMTYNIRMNTPSDGENAWPLRKEFLASQVLFHAPDVLGIQEGLPEQVAWLNQRLKNYATLGVGRDGGDNGEYSAIYYRKDKLRVQDSGTFWLSETPNLPSKGWDAALNRICTWAKFEPRGGGPSFFVFNTHFDHRGEKARIKSAALILEKMSSLNPEGSPSFLVGDLNLMPETAPIQAFHQSLQDAYLVAPLRLGPAGTFNGFHHDEPAKRRIDYIMASQSKRMHILNFATLTDAIDGKYPSDHFPLVATIILE